MDKKASSKEKTKNFKKNKKRFYIAMICAIIFFIAGYAIFGNNGLRDVLKIKEEKKGIVTENNALKKENEALGTEKELLSSDKNYIARVAREELGMIGEDEFLYKFESSDEEKVTDK